jgi:outer membrane lipoprotein-sorting protein
MKSLYHGLRLASFLCFATSAVAQQNNPLQIIPLKPDVTAAPKTPGNNSFDFDIASVVTRANSALNSMNTLSADFVQSNSFGQHATGRLFLLKPGRLRFEYAAPSTLEIIADGTSVAIRNKRLNTQDVYFIRQTPLKFLLKPSINLAQDVKVMGVTFDAEHTIVKVEDKSTFGGASKIELFFRSSDFLLSQWIITDPQGGETKVKLSNLDQSKRLDRSLFVISFDRPENQ